MQEELDVCMLHCGMIQVAPIPHDLSKRLATDGAALYSLLLPLLTNYTMLRLPFWPYLRQHDVKVTGN